MLSTRIILYLFSNMKVLLLSLLSVVIYVYHKHKLWKMWVQIRDDPLPSWYWYLHVMIYAAIWPRSLHWMKFFGLCMQMNQVIYVRGKSVLFYNFFWQELRRRRTDVTIELRKVRGIPYCRFESISFFCFHPINEY